MSDKAWQNENITRIPIDGTLDLHTFHPSDIGSLIPEYLRQCQNNGIFHVRLIHGKGVGNLRRGVHAVLKKSPLVKSFTLADETGGSWGATLVKLHDIPDD